MAGAAKILAVTSTALPPSLSRGIFSGTEEEGAVNRGVPVAWAAALVLAMACGSGEGGNGAGKELAVIAAVVIGGTSITGGRGSVLGTVLGALLVQTVASGVTQLGWRSELSDLFVGVAIIIAVGADLIRERARRKR